MKHALVIAKAVVSNDDGQVLLLRRHGGSKNRPLQWDFAGGKVDDNEDFTAAAVREIQEETGLSVSHEDLHLIWTESAEEADETVCRLFFICSVSDNNVQISDEHVEFAWKTLDEAIAEYEYPRHNRVLRMVRDKQLLG